MTGIVVGIDGSAGSKAALRAAFREARAHGETLRVVHAYDASARQEPGAPQTANVELRAAAQRRIADVLAEVDGDGDGGVDVVAEAVAIRGTNAAQALVHASKGASMLVVGSRGLDGFMGLLIGSVGQQCVQHATCPVLVVPQADERRG